jgi:hypothetical protein
MTQISARVPPGPLDRSRDGRIFIQRPVRSRFIASSHMLSSVDCITTTSESEFSVDTRIDVRR